MTPACSSPWDAATNAPRFRAFVGMTGHCPIPKAVPWMRFVRCATISRFVLQDSFRLRDWKRRQRDCCQATPRRFPVEQFL
jgi:hypothetical protein